MMKNSDGVSSVIGAVLMISLVVVAVAVISVMLLSQPTAEEIPELSVIAGVNPIANKFTIFHEGGDALTLGTFSLMLDSGSGYEDKTSDFTLVGGGELWSIGEYMTYDYGAGSPPVGLKIVYHGKSGDMLLTSVPIAYSGNVTTYGGDTEIGLSEVVPVEDIPEWFAENTSQTSVMYYLQDGDADFNAGGYLEFTITGEGSTYTVEDNTPRNLLPGQTMKIVLDSGNGKIFAYGLGSMFYALRFNDIDLYLDGVRVTYQSGWSTLYADNLVYCHITEYDPESVTSSLEAEVNVWNIYEALRINGTLIHEGDGGNYPYGEIYRTFTNMKPCDTGAFLISSPGSWEGFDFLGDAIVGD